MSRKTVVILSALLSFSALAEVSMQEKIERVDVLKSLNSGDVLALDSFNRALNYEAKNLAEGEKVQAEVNLLISTIRSQTVTVYHQLLENGKSHEEAVDELKEMALSDLDLADPSIREDLKNYSLLIINDIEKGVSEEVQLHSVENYVLKGVRERSMYLNQEDPGALKSLNFEKQYSSKNEILSELTKISYGASSPLGSSNEIKSERALKIEAEISLQVKMEYLGVSVEAGPQINFKREYTTYAAVAAEGMSPFLLNNGNFDFWKRDFDGKIIKEKGKEAKRNLTFVCQTELKFTSDYRGAGGFKFQGVGATATVSKTYSNAVSLNSRRVEVPEYVDNKSVTLKYLADLCHIDFLKAKVSSNLNVTQALNISMKNVISGIRFSHPETKCTKDSDCLGWFKKQSVNKNRSTARCVQSPGREKFFKCEARGFEGYSCLVTKDGRKMSLGRGELICDKGLKCVEKKLEYYRIGENFHYYIDARCEK